MEAGPTVEVQVRVNTGRSVAGSVFNWKVISPRIVTWPVGGNNITQSVAILMLFYNTGSQFALVYSWPLSSLTE